MSALLLEKSRVEDFWLRCAVFYYFPPLSNPSLESWPPATSRLPQRWSMCAQGACPRLWADRQTSSSTGTRSEGERKVPGPGPSPSSRVPHNSDSQGSCQLGWLCACMLSRFSHDQLFVTLWTVACQAPLSRGLLIVLQSRGSPG